VRGKYFIYKLNSKSVSRLCLVAIAMPTSTNGRFQPTNGRFELMNGGKWTLAMGDMVSVEHSTVGIIENDASP
jgi:hypothetical protein